MDLPAQIAAQLCVVDQSEVAGLLEQAQGRYMVRTTAEASRMGYAAWMPVAVLRQMPWPLEQPWASKPWQQMLQAEFGRHSRFECSPQLWADAQVPKPYWLHAGASENERLAYWFAGLQAQAWVEEEPLSLQPYSLAQLSLWEWLMSCKMPAPLRNYHLQLGVLEWTELLLTPQIDLADAAGDMEAMAPAFVVFPGVADIVEMQDQEVAVALTSALEQLVAFGDYLGNGNLWCFDRRDGSVWYLDHDTSPLLSRMFDDAGDYLDALTVIALSRAHALANGRDDGDELAEDMLSERWGQALLRKWMY